jgi:hypothetical protein
MSVSKIMPLKSKPDWVIVFDSLWKLKIDYKFAGMTKWVKV